MTISSNKGYGWVLLTLLLFTLSACNPNGKGNSTNIAIDSVDYQLSDTLRPSDSLQVVYSNSIHYEYPNDPKLIAKLNRLVFPLEGVESLSPREATEQYIRKYSLGSTDTTRMEEQFSYLSGVVNYESELSNKIVFQDQYLLSTIIYEYEYEGGAHGLTTEQYVTLLKDKANTVVESDLFVPNSEEELGRIIVGELMKQHQVKTTDELNDLGYFNSKEIQPNGNFYLDDKGIYYCYVSYEIAPYALGTTVVFLPYTLIEPLLLPDTFVRRYLK